VLGDAARRHEPERRPVGGAEDDHVGLSILGQLPQHLGGRTLLDVDRVQLAAVAFHHPLREDAGVLAGLGLLIAADDLGIERLWHGPRA
jgi:hypothetical protein